jgi:predicted transglutaminase-like cysteine proteinase
LKRLWLIALILLFSQKAAVEINFSPELFESIEKKYGVNAREAVKKWQLSLESIRNENIQDQLFEVNRFFNKLEFKEDIEHWNQNDYWATPIEFLATEAGDCEDYTIAKYFSLLELGVDSNKLRLIYVTALRPRQAHMVLGYYETPQSIPLILDNINKRIMPANQRRDLLPIYSFNGDGLWLAKSQGRGRQVQSGGNNSLWVELNERMKQGY